MKRLAVLATLVALVACGDAPTSNELDPSFAVAGGESTTYILLVQGRVSTLGAAVRAAGGTLDVVYPFGVAVATSANADFARSLRGVATAVADVGFDGSLPAAMEAGVTTDAGFPPNSGDDDFYFDLQWGHNYVGAQQAWAAGSTGQGVRVAVLDTGFDLDHPDLAPNINLALSMDFTGEGLQYGLPDAFSHGTHTAGTIAAADNGFGTIGVAPDAELVLVKVLSDAGSGSFANIIAGIYHAADVDADIISMSLGTIVPRTADPVGVTMLANATSRAMRYARQNGTLVITSAGNAAWNLDGDADNVRFMNGLSGATGISALTPLNWASDPENAELVPASYTNYGTSAVDFSAPGGSVDYPGNEGCVVAGLARPCWVFDLVFSTGNGGWYWSAGTSMAAPHAAGVAALIISANGGPMHPAQVEAAMRHAAVEMADGRTDFFGHGLVNSGF
jgi:subtilisin family serine protease